jgi:Bacterial aa3 type cytochrome c oxidase subunit IV
MSDDPMLQERQAAYHDFVRLVAYSAAAAAITLIVLAIILL